MNGRLFYRALPLSARAVDRDSRTAEVAFSSETPVVRWFGPEILLHGRDNLDLSRLKSMGAALFNHNPDRIVGRIEGARIEGRRGLARIVFDEDQEGEQAMHKALTGSLQGVSVGYQVSKFRELREGEAWKGYTGPCYLAERWTPYEVSLTPIPADPSVGVGRDATRSLDGIEVEYSSFRGKQTMSRHYEGNETVNVRVDVLANVVHDEAKRLAVEVVKALGLDYDTSRRVLVLIRAACGTDEALFLRAAELWQEDCAEGFGFRRSLEYMERELHTRSRTGTYQGEPGRAPALRLEHISDEWFDQAITNPAALTITDPPAGQRAPDPGQQQRGKALDSVSDEAFDELLKDPKLYFH